MQIKTTLKFEIFYARKTGAGKFMRKYFAKNFCPDNNIFKHLLTHSVLSFQVKVSNYSLNIYILDNTKSRLKIIQRKISVWILISYLWGI